MEARIGRMLDMLLRVRVMLTRPEFAALSPSPAIAMLGATIAELQAYDRQQNAGERSSQGETARQRKLRRALLVQLRTVSAAGRLQLPAGPELVKFAMPRGRPSIDQLLTAAGGMRLAAAEHQDVLLAAGLEPDFIEQMEAAASAVRDSITERSVHRGARREATVAMHAIAKRIRQLVLVLDGRVKRLVGEDDGLLAEWKQASRIGRKPGAARRSRPPAPALEAVTSSQPAPATNVAPTPRLRIGRSSWLTRSRWVTRIVQDLLEPSALGLRPPAPQGAGG